MINNSININSDEINSDDQQLYQYQQSEQPPVT